MPGQKKTDGLIDSLVSEAESFFDKRTRALKKIVDESSQSDFESALGESFDADFIMRLGETLFGGSVIALEAGRAETRAKRTRSRKTTPLSSPRKRGEREDWRPGVEDYSGPAIEVDFFRLRSFTMAHVTDAGILQSLKDELQKILEGGGTFQDFRSRAVDLLGEMADENHLRTVYVTNLQTAYNAGKYYEGMDAREELPFWEYLTANDGKVRPAHLAMHGRIYRKDHPIWNYWYPPNGFGCRCTVAEHDQYSIDEEKLKVWDDWPVDDDEKFLTPDQGFENNAAADAGILQELARQWQMAERLWGEYELAALPAQKPPEPAILPGDVKDAEGLLRTIPAGLAAQYGEYGSLIEMTLRDPQEVWGWPGRNLFYIAAYETAEGVKSVAVEVWGEVKAVHVVSGSADEFRKGMLLRKT